MGCLVGCVALAFPRLVLFVMFVTSNYIGRAYETNLWPVMGFFFMPLTTIAYAWAVNVNGTVTGVPIALEWVQAVPSFASSVGHRSFPRW